MFSYMAHFERLVHIEYGQDFLHAVQSTFIQLFVFQPSALVGNIFMIQGWYGYGAHESDVGVSPILVCLLL